MSPTPPSLSTRDLARWAARHLAPHKGLLAVVLTVEALAAATAGIVDPLLMAGIVESLTDGATGLFVRLIVAAVVVSTVLRGLTYVSSVVHRKLTNALTADLVGNAFESFSERAPAKVAAHEPGYHLSRIFDEPRRVAETVRVATSIVRSALLAVGALGLCLYLAWEVALGLAVVVPVLVALSRRYGGRVAAETVRGDEEEATLRSHVGRSVRGHVATQTFGLGAVVKRYVGGALDRLLATRYRRTREASRLRSASALFLSYAENLVLVGAGIQVLRGALTVGGLFGFTKAFWHVVGATRKLVDLLPEVATAKGQVERYLAYTAEAAGEARSPLHETETPVTLLRDVSFGHGADALFEHLDLAVRPGERVLISGPNGSGKSTLARLLVGALAPTAGHALVPPLASVSSVLLPFGFPPGTVREYLQLDERSGVEQARILRLASRLGLDAFLDRDPDGLSQGEKRRVQVLLALAKRAALYVFDEPLSNVDARGRDLLMDTILEETESAALLVILHGGDRYHAAFERHLAIDGGAVRETATYAGEADRPAAWGGGTQARRVRTPSESA